MSIRWRKRKMTLKEILDKVEFADIVNPLVERAPQCEDNLY